MKKYVFLVLAVICFIGLNFSVAVASVNDILLSKKEFIEIMNKCSEIVSAPCPDAMKGCLVYHVKKVYDYEKIVKELCKKFGCLETKKEEKIIEEISLQ